MAKKSKTAPPRPLTRKQRTRAEREARMNRWVIGAAIGVGILVVAVLIYGYVAEVVLKAREPVAVVNQERISTAEFEARVRFRRLSLQQERDFYAAQRMSLDPTDPAVSSYLQQLDTMIRTLDSRLSPEYAVALGQQVLDEMVTEILVRQEARRRGIVVSREEIERAIEEQFGYDRDAPAEGSVPSTTGPLTVALPITSATSLTETQAITLPNRVTREEFQQRYQDYAEMILKPSGLSQEQYYALVEASLLYDKVRTAIGEELPEVMEQVQVRYVAFPSEEEATQMVDRLQGGDAWEDIVAEIEADGSSTAYTSEPGWLTRVFLAEQFGEAIGTTVFDTAVGDYTQPLLGLSGRYYVIQVLGHKERELEAFMLSFEQDRAFQEWLNEQMSLVEYSDNWREKVPTQP